jgi:integrase
MLGYNFSKVVSAAKNSESATDFKAIRFNARMLRHTCATYFVYEALKAQNRLGRSFVYDAALDEDLRKCWATLMLELHLNTMFI